MDADWLWCWQRRVEWTATVDMSSSSDMPVSAHFEDWWQEAREMLTTRTRKGVDSLIILVTLQLWKEKQEWFQQWCYSHARPHELCKRIFRFWVVATDKELGALRSSSFWPPRFILRSGCSDLFCLSLWLLRLCKNFCPILIHWQVTLLWVVLQKMEPNNVQGDFMSRYASTFSKAYDCMCKCR